MSSDQPIEELEDLDSFESDASIEDVPIKTCPIGVCSGCGAPVYFEFGFCGFCHPEF